ncbi:MAG: aldo/keto reductase family protein, partial [Candidatus Zixiibacteriota bacterium]
KTIDEKGARRIIFHAIEQGINFIDISDIYAKGKAEEVIGQCIVDLNRSDLVISSKAFWPMSDNVNDRGLSRKHLFESVHKSLKRLRTDYLDIYFCHRFDPDTEIEEVVRAMDDLVHQGKILYWGTSVWEVDQIDEALQQSRALLAYGPVVEQPRYNMLDRHIEDAIMPLCSNNGMGLVVWSPLAQGLLTGKYLDGVPTASRGSQPMYMEDELSGANMAIVRKLSSVASRIGIPLNQLALAWILRRPEISCAITGATSVEQVTANVQASQVSLSDDVLAEIEKILE